MKKTFLIPAALCLLTAACSNKNDTETVTNTLPLITVEEHFTAPEIIEANARYAHLKPAPTGKLAEAMQFFSSRRFIGEALTDIDAKRLPHMDSLGIGMQILSYTASIDDVVPAGGAVRQGTRLCRGLAHRTLQRTLLRRAGVLPCLPKGGRTGRPRLLAPRLHQSAGARLLLSVRQLLCRGGCRTWFRRLRVAY